MHTSKSCAVPSMALLTRGCRKIDQSQQATEEHVLLLFARVYQSVCTWNMTLPWFRFEPQKTKKGFLFLCISEAYSSCSGRYPSYAGVGSVSLAVSALGSLQHNHRCNGLIDVRFNNALYFSIFYFFVFLCRRTENRIPNQID